MFRRNRQVIEVESAAAELQELGAIVQAAADAHQRRLEDRRRDLHQSAAELLAQYQAGR